MCVCVSICMRSNNACFSLRFIFIFVLLFALVIFPAKNGNGAFLLSKQSTQSSTSNFHRADIFSCHIYDNCIHARPTKYLYSVLKCKIQFLPFLCLSLSLTHTGDDLKQLFNHLFFTRKFMLAFIFRSAFFLSFACDFFPLYLRFSLHFFFISCLHCVQVLFCFLFSYTRYKLSIRKDKAFEKNELQLLKAKLSESIENMSIVRWQKQINWNKC